MERFMAMSREGWDAMQDEVLRHVVSALEHVGVEHMVCGSIVSSFHGEARFTRDIDLVCDLGPEQVLPLLEHFDEEEWYYSEPAIREAIELRSQFNLIHQATGLKVDCLLSPRSEWGRTQLKRRESLPLLPDASAWAARAEDIILAKLIYYREGRHQKHTDDIQAMLRVSGDDLDYGYLDDWSRQLGVAELWQEVRTAAGR